MKRAVRALSEVVGFVAAAVLVAWLGGMSRPYGAFGGEDMVALALIGYGIARAVAKAKEVRV